MIRKAIQQDASEIEVLMKSEHGFWNEKWRDDVLSVGIANANGLAFVYVEEAKIKGFICGHDVGFRAYLSELIVSKEIRGKGIGKQLLHRIEKELENRGCNLMIADVWRDAEMFYRSQGWSEPDVVLLRKKLK